MIDYSGAAFGPLPVWLAIAIAIYSIILLLFAYRVGPSIFFWAVIGEIIVCWPFVYWMM